MSAGTPSDDQVLFFRIRSPPPILTVIVTVKSHACILIQYITTIVQYYMYPRSVEENLKENDK